MSLGRLVTNSNGTPNQSLQQTGEQHELPLRSRLGHANGEDVLRRSYVVAGNEAGEERAEIGLELAGHDREGRSEGEATAHGSQLAGFAAKRGLRSLHCQHLSCFHLSLGSFVEAFQNVWKVCAQVVRDAELLGLALQMLADQVHFLLSLLNDLGPREGPHADTI